MGANVGTAIKRILFWLSCAYVLALAGCMAIWFALPASEEAGSIESVCYWTTSLVMYVECRGFLGDTVAAYVLNVPLLLAYGPTFLGYELTHAATLWKLAVLSALHWIPLVYVVGYSVAMIRRWHRERAVTRRA